MSDQAKKEYFSSLSQIAEFLLGDKKNVEYVLNLFYENEVKFFAYIFILFKFNE
jgi:hypothetical protein